MKRSKNNLRFENLEQRQLMAGDVQAYVSGGDLIIRGDNADNGVLVSEVADGQYAVVGLHQGGAGTLINGESEVHLSGVTDDVDIQLREGNDKLHINNARQTDTLYYPESGPVPAYSEVPDDLRIHMQGGHDEVNLTSVDVGSDVYLYTQGGADSVDLNHVLADGRLWISTGNRWMDGGDQVAATGLHVGSLGVWTGDGADTVELRGQNIINGDMDVNTGGGNDEVNVTDQSVWYRHLRTSGDVDIETGGDDDRVYLRGVEGQQDVTIRTGDGRDVVTVYDSTVGYERDVYAVGRMHTGALTVEAGDDRDSVNMYENHVANDVSVDLGEGDNLAWLGNVSAGVPAHYQDAPQDASISVRSGAGRDQVSITRSESTDAIMAELGSGNDGFIAQFSKADLGYFDLGLGSDTYQLWQNDFGEQEVINPLYPQIILPVWWP